MSEQNKKQVYLVTGVKVAVDSEDGILIAGIVSDNPFIDEGKELEVSPNLVGTFAFTRQQAEFLRDRLDEFLREKV